MVVVEASAADEARKRLIDSETVSVEKKKKKRLGVAELGNHRTGSKAYSLHFSFLFFSCLDFSFFPIGLKISNLGQRSHLCVALLDSSNTTF